MKMKINILPDDIIEKYNLRYIVYNEYVYFKIKMGMYELPEAGIMANKLLKKRISKHGYYKCQFTPGLYHHVWRPIMFRLVVDDFGVKCQGIQHAKHLKEALEKYYKVAVYWKGGLFCGITLDWYYNMRHVDLSVTATSREIELSTNIPIQKSRNTTRTKRNPFSTTPRCFSYVM